MPISCNLSINKPWETLSKALEKSKTATCIDTPLSIDAIKLLVVETNWGAQERPLLKPCCSGHKKTFKNWTKMAKYYVLQ